MKTTTNVKEDVRFSEIAPAAAKTSSSASSSGKPEIVSTLGQGMMITGDIVCTGAMHVFGRVIGDIHAAQLVICEGAKVEGKLIAPDVAVQGEFKGTINGNTVKLLATAVVDGEVFSKSLSIEQDALFEGVARRIDKPVAAPTSIEPKVAPKVEAPVYTPPAPAYDPQPSFSNQPSFQPQTFSQQQGFQQSTPDLKIVS